MLKTRMRQQRVDIVVGRYRVHAGQQPGGLVSPRPHADEIDVVGFRQHRTGEQLRPRSRTHQTNPQPSAHVHTLPRAFCQT